MNLTQRIKQRYRDFIHEGAIRRVQKDIVRLELHGWCSCNDFDPYLKVADLDRELRNLESKRSQTQLARMGK